MNKKSAILLGIAICIALFTALTVRNRLHQAPVEQAQAGHKVLVATTAIPAGTFIRAEAHLKWVDWPEATLQPAYITQGSRVAEEFNGSVTRRAVSAGEPITDSIVVKTSEGGFMSAVLSPGMRAVSIAVNATSGNAGFIFPGDKVDLIVTHAVPLGVENNTGQNAVVSETFVENVRILAVDQMLDNPENKAVLAKTVTLEVTPKQAEMVNVASDLGKISLSLRSLAVKKEDTAQPVKTENPDLVDPFFLDIPPSDAQTTQENVTRASDVSKILGGHRGYNAQVNVIRGDKVEKLQFNQSAP